MNPSPTQPSGVWPCGWVGLLQSRLPVSFPLFKYILVESQRAGPQGCLYWSRKHSSVVTMVITDKRIRGPMSFDLLESCKMWQRNKIICPIYSTFVCFQNSPAHLYVIWKEKKSKKVIDILGGGGPRNLHHRPYRWLVFSPPEFHIRINQVSLFTLYSERLHHYQNTQPPPPTPPL